MKETADIEGWILIRDGEVIKIFKDRKKAVAFFKKLLLQTLKDFERQDKSDEFDYSIEVPSLKFYPVRKREAYLGL